MNFAEKFNIFTNFCQFIVFRLVLLNNQRDAALSSCIYSSLQG
jgi:hypothetical protein